MALDLANTGLEVVDLGGSSEFAKRRLKPHDPEQQLAGMRRLYDAFVKTPDTILQELANCAVDLCGADSAGISIEQRAVGDEKYWLWVATAGQYSGFAMQTLPRQPSACGVCLERGRPQHLRVSEPFFNLLNVTAASVTDGILLPWRAGEQRGTIWILAHGRQEAFDSGDLRLMQSLADFAGMAMRHRQRQVNSGEGVSTASASLAMELAEQVHDHIQMLASVALLVRSEREHEGEQRLAALEELMVLRTDDRAPN